MEKYKRILHASLVPCLLLFSACINDNSSTGRKDIPDISDDRAPFEYFVDISGIPRCTYSEKAASDYLVAFAESLGLEARQDKMYNVLIRKGGSRGREDEPYIILQAHIDMVCGKDDDVDHDFDNDPIVPIVEGDWIRARKRTTLGADNGGGVSIVMAALASNNISHPPIEALLTTQEEIGLVGADSFDISWLHGRRLINLDITTKEVLLVSSKRGDGPEIIIPLEPKALAKIASLPDWPYRENSPLRDRMVEVFRDYYGFDPPLVGINNSRAGVECLSFAGKDADLDMVSIGPEIIGIHTPDERMSLSSYNRVYEYLVRVLKVL